NGFDIHLKGSALIGLLHHKYAIVDAGTTADQIVITGSHNWSSSAETSNNENTLIFHSKRIANLYLQEFKARYEEAGGADVISDVKDDSKAPTTFKLMQNYPNPFNPSTVITYSIPKESHVTLTVFNILGQQIKTLVDQEKSTGTYKVNFDGSGLSSGVYFYCVRAGDYFRVRKMLLLK
ncbi:MAG: phospholipase D-like domain-containing protein, partial [Ignavibacteriaceae bacterium]